MDMQSWTPTPKPELVLSSTEGRCLVSFHRTPECLSVWTQALGQQNISKLGVRGWEPRPAPYPNPASTEVSTCGLNLLPLSVFCQAVFEVTGPHLVLVAA